MPHLNIYVPEELAKSLRQQAKLKKTSLSGYFVELIRGQKPSHEWDKEFLKKAIGGWKGDFPEIKRELPGDLDAL